MKLRIPKIKLLAMVLLALLVPLALATGKENKRTYRKFVMKNGLKVVLVSDPDVNVSAASMDVSIGSLADPEKRMGMAHFLEHMLFLATKKYPKLNEYGEYLKSQGGYSNAFTASDQTNYHFQVNHDGLEGALDRFAQFFISPVLDFNYAQREVMAVNSEHQKGFVLSNWIREIPNKAFITPQLVVNESPG